MPYTYIVKCSDGSYYTGWALDLTKRLAVHNAGKGAKYTRGRLPVVLVWSNFFEDKRLAQSLEVKIKALSRLEKEALILGEAELCSKILESR